MARPLRLFIAVKTPPPVVSAIKTLIETVERTNVTGLRPVRPEGVHLTLRFLGGVEPERAPEIADAVASAASGVPPFVLRLDRPGVFPGRGSPRVLWVGLDGDVEGLAALQRAVEGAMASLGFPEERRVFHPHLTVARLRDRTPVTDRRTASEAFLQVQSLRDLPMPVTHLSLMQSTLRPGGAVYTRLAHMPLGAVAG